MGVFFCLILLWIALPAAAQGDAPNVQPIGIGMSVEESITAAAPFDWWQIDAEAGDAIRITIEAYDGLAPLLGILDADRSLITSSEDGAPNGTLELRYQFAAAGQHTIVAARVGLNDGTTTGRYVLTVERVGAPAVRDPNLQEVVFLCEGQDVVTLATINFRADPGDMTSYRVTLIGTEGFSPVIRFVSPEQATDVCLLPDPEDRVEATFSFPDGTQGMSSAATARQLVINAVDVDLGDMTVITGGLDGSTGRYITLVEGFSLVPETDSDTITVRLGALPAESTSLLAYMIQTTNRLDPVVTLEGVPCDDAGRRGCASVPAVTGAGINFTGYGSVIGDRFDAGALITDTLPHALTLSSFANRTQGNYALMLVGELPPRTFGD